MVGNFKEDKLLTQSAVRCWNDVMLEKQTVECYIEDVLTVVDRICKF